MPDIKDPHGSSDELPDHELPEGGEESGDLPDDFAGDGDDVVETPLSEAAIAAMLSAAVDEHGEKKRCGLVAIVGRPNVGKSRRAAEQASAQQLLDRIKAGELDVPIRKGHPGA